MTQLIGVVVELPRPNFLVVILFWSYAGNAVAAVSQRSLFNELEMVSCKLVEFVFHLPDRRFGKESNGLPRRRLLIERLPQVGPVRCNNYQHNLIRYFLFNYW